MEVMLAVSRHKRQVGRYIVDHSDGRIEPEAQYDNAVRRRFISDAFEDRE